MENKGFTLVELLIGLTLFGLSIGIFYEIFLSQAKAYHFQEKKLETHQSLRESMEFIVRDIRGAGFPSQDPPLLANLRDWVPADYIPKVPQTVDLNGAINIADGGSLPDTLSFFIVLHGENNPLNLTNTTQIGDTMIELPLSGNELAEKYKGGDIIYIGKPSEYAKVIGTGERQLYIDTNPVQAGNQGFKKAYPSGTELGEISLVSYTVFNDSNDSGNKNHDQGISVLKRKINGMGFQPVAEQINNLKINQNSSGLMTIQLSAKGRLTVSKDPLVLSTKVLKRN